MGISCDWSRSFFTLDKVRENAVIESFVRFWEDGKIYRENRLVNWCCKLKTAISDIEVEYKEIENPEYLWVPGYDNQIKFGILHKFA